MKSLILNVCKTGREEQSLVASISHPPMNARPPPSRIFGGKTNIREEPDRKYLLKARELLKEIKR
jgi:hypothetical protein